MIANTSESFRPVGVAPTGVLRSGSGSPAACHIAAAGNHEKLLLSFARLWQENFVGITCVVVQDSNQGRKLAELKRLIAHK
jgi:hypothetical protein